MTPDKPARPILRYEQTFEYQGLQFHYRTEVDTDHEPPWEDGDGQGIVSDWTRRDKLPGERLLHSDRSSKRYFDWQATMAKAKEERWGLSDDEGAKLKAKLGRDPTQGEITAASVESNYQWMRRWCNDQWHYIFVIVELLDEEGAIIDSESLGGVEDSDDQYPSDIAYELADELASRYRKQQEKARVEAEQAAFKRLELRNSALKIERLLQGQDAMLDFHNICQAAGIDLSDKEPS